MALGGVNVKGVKQSDIKNIQEILNAIQVLIGENTNDTTQLDSVMAKLNKLLTDWTTTRATKIDNIGATEDTDGTTTAGTVMGKLNALLNTMSSGVGIKSVQRGTFSYGSAKTNTRTANIRAVNIGKSFLISHNGESYSSSNYSLISLSSTQVVQSSSGSTSNTYYFTGVYWQVVEFY